MSMHNIQYIHYTNNLMKVLKENNMILIFNLKYIYNKLIINGMTSICTRYYFLNIMYNSVNYS